MGSCRNLPDEWTLRKRKISVWSTFVSYWDSKLPKTMENWIAYAEHTNFMQNWIVVDRLNVPCCWLDQEVVIQPTLLTLAFLPGSKHSWRLSLSWSGLGWIGSPIQNYSVENYRIYSVTGSNDRMNNNWYKDEWSYQDQGCLTSRGGGFSWDWRT